MSKYICKLKRQPTKVNHKWCVKCQSEKSHNEFEPNPKLKSGLASWCKSCENQYALERHTKLYKEDSHFRWKTKSRQTLRDVIYKSGLLKDSFEEEFKEVIGCSIDEFKTYIESRFQPGMSWSNYGKERGKWSIDHKDPLAKSEEGSNINHYTNLQPLWVSDNSKKGAK